jgi:hypothetical protein
MRDWGVTNSPLQTFDVLLRATSCSTLVSYDLALLDGSNTSCYDPWKNASYICIITPKRLVNFWSFQIPHKVALDLSWVWLKSGFGSQLVEPKCWVS